MIQQPRVIVFGPRQSGKTQLIQAFRTVPGASGLDILDSESTLAEHLLASPQEFQAPPELSLAGKIRESDGLVMLVDATWDRPTLHRYFESFRKFLISLQWSRSYSREVGGQPIYIAITKCDSLLPPDTPLPRWNVVMEARRAEVEREFLDYFSTEAPGFGTLDVHVVPTATAIPADHPLTVFATAGNCGVVELAKRLTESAGNFHTSEITSNRKVRWTLSGSATLMAGLITMFAIVFSLSERGPVDELSERIHRYREHEAPASQRLSDKHFTESRQQILQFRNNQVFSQLPTELQKFVNARVQELDAYTQYRRLFLPPQLGPAEVRTNADMQRLEQELGGKLACPPEYVIAWKDTDAVRLHDKWVKDLELLKRAEDETHQWYRMQIATATRLQQVGAPNVDWLNSLSQLMEDRPAFQSDNKIPGSESLPIRRGEALTYATAFSYERTQLAIRDWKIATQSISDLYDLCKLMPFVFSKTNPGVNDPLMSLALIGHGSEAILKSASQIYDKLLQSYSYLKDEPQRWSLKRYPNPIRGMLGLWLRISFDMYLSQAQSIISEQIVHNGDTPDGWAKLASGLKDPRWVDFGKLMALFNPEGSDPVVELLRFINQSPLIIPAAEVEVFIPNNLMPVQFTPDGSLTITTVPAIGQPRSWLYKSQTEPKSELGGRLYTLAPEKQADPFIYSQGDGFVMEWKLKSGVQKFILKWNEGRTKTFQLDRIAGNPTLEQVDPLGSLERVVKTVRFTMNPKSNPIRVPVLLPRLPGVK